MQERTTFSGNRRTWSVLVLVFIVSTVLRGVIAANYGEYTVFGDEFLHVKLAQNIAAGRGLVIRGTLQNYTTCLYSIVISPAFLLSHNTETAHIMILWINAALMSSAVFPIYLIARKFLENTWHVWLAVAYGLLISEMNYTLQAMQENLNYPLMMWFFLAFACIILEKRDNVLYISGLGAFACILSRCKEMNLAIVFAVPLYFAVQFLTAKKIRRQTVRDAAVYTGTYFVLNRCFNFVMGILLADAVGGRNLTNNILKVFNYNTLSKLVYPAIMYVFFTLLATGVFPLPMLAGNWKIISEKSKKMLTFVLCFLLISIGAICAMIVPSESLGDMIIYFHSRYYFYGFIVIMILFLQLYEAYQNNGKVGIESLFFLGGCAVFAAFLPVVIKTGSHVFRASTLYLWLLTEEEVLQNTMRCIVILVVIYGMYLVYKREIKNIYRITAGFLILTTPINCYFYIKSQDKSAAVLAGQNDALLLNDYFSKGESVQDLKNDFLLISSTSAYDFRFETYLALPYKFTSISHLQVGKEIDFTELPLAAYSIEWTDSDAAIPKYIISVTSLPLQGYDEVDIGMELFHLFQKNDDTAMLLSRKSNIHGDWWLGNTAATLQYAGALGCTDAVLSLTVDNWLLGGETTANYKDDSGYSGSFSVPATFEKTIIEIPVHKSADATAYTVTIEPTEAVQPGNGDTRNLSFRLFDYEITEETS